MEFHDDSGSVSTEFGCRGTFWTISIAAVNDSSDGKEKGTMQLAREHIRTSGQSHKASNQSHKNKGSKLGTLKQKCQEIAAVFPNYAE
jgi:hypothetical protein